MDRDDFSHNKEEGLYQAVVGGLEIYIHEDDMSGEAVALAREIADAYPESVGKIAACIASDSAYGDFYTAEEISERLNEPQVRINSAGGILTYLNHELDADHVIDVYFSGVFETIDELSLGG